MNKQRVKLFWIVGVTVMALSFGLLWLGIKVILGNSVNIPNILAFTLLSLVFGGLSGAFYALDFKAAFTLFASGLIIGFFSMFWQFIAGMDGWGDLSGLLSLFFCAGIGLAAGILVQLLWYIIQKVRHKK
ncbi:MAG: hypothetical protein PHR18_03255 [Oscillospiraceae bacterium]|nr:hypothetical protein [Oscillospiraceae bacterium]MDD3832904.1 hypothetical protein [Oscillospiraceae bacterium]